MSESAATLKVETIFCSNFAAKVHALDKSNVVL